MNGIRGAICLGLLMLWLLGPVSMNAQRDQGQACPGGSTDCFSEPDNNSASSDRTFEHTPSPVAPRTVTMLVRGPRRGPFAHHWIELDGLSQGPVTIHFGPATIPFIDMGQISILDSHGDLESVPKFHFLAEHYKFAKAPGYGRTFGAPIELTVAQADTLIEKQRHRKFVGPYIPLFHDCRTFVCTAQASAQGKSTLPCYLLLKGYW